MKTVAIGGAVEGLHGDGGAVRQRRVAADAGQRGRVDPQAPEGAVVAGDGGVVLQRFAKVGQRRLLVLQRPAGEGGRGGEAGDQEDAAQTHGVVSAPSMPR